MSTESKCSCQRCGEHIAFPSELDNTETECPHCHKVTTLLAQSPVRAIPAPKQVAADDLGALITTGYTTAIFLPLVGFVIGLILLGKNRPSVGMYCILLSLACGAIWMAILNTLSEIL